MMSEEFLNEIRQDLAEIKQAVTLCGPCREMVHRHDEAIFGNGNEGLLSRVKGVEASQRSSRNSQGDVVSVKSLKMILLAVGALSTTLAAAIAGILQVALK